MVYQIMSVLLLVMMVTSLLFHREAAADPIQDVRNFISNTMTSTALAQLRNYSALVQYIDGQEQNLSAILCSNELWAQGRTQYSVPLRRDVPCYQFAQTTGYVPEQSPPASNYTSCWQNGGDCGYFTFQGWYFDFRFDNPEFTIDSGIPTVSLNIPSRQIDIAYRINSVSLSIPDSALRWRYWYSDRQYENLGPPDYPNAWQSCCQSVLWPEGSEWNAFSQSVSLQNLDAQLSLTYQLNRNTGEIILYLNNFQLNPAGNASVDYQYNDVFVDGSIGEQYLEEPLRRAIARLLENQLNTQISFVNRRYGNLNPPLELLRLSSPIPLSVVSNFMDLDFGSYLRQLGQMFNGNAALQVTLQNLIDTDGDSLPDWDEISVYRTNPDAADTDGDGLNDDQEIVLGLNPRVSDNPIPAIITNLLLDD